MMRRALAGSLAAVLAMAASATAYPRPGRTERISVADDGAEANNGAGSPRLSDDGRYVAFVSDASNLVPGDTNNQYDVFVRDRVLGRTERVSIADDESQAAGMTLSPDMSADGRFVVFTSSAKNLAPGDVNNTWDIYIRDRKLGTTELVSRRADGSGFPGGAGDGHVSDDGRMVSFASGDTTVVPGDTNSTFDVFVRDRQAGTTELVSRSSSGVQATAETYWNDMSGDGGSVAYYSFASNLVPNDTNGATDVFVRDLATDTTRRVSVASDGSEGNADSILPSLSFDGRSVAFVSYASNLVPNDANPINDVFVHDLTTRRTERVSITSDGADASNTGLASNWAPTISSDARYVAFNSSANNLAPGDSNAQTDQFVHDRLLGITERVSISSAGAEAVGSNASAQPAVNGRHVAFVSNATNLVPGDDNADYDVFLRDRGPELGIGELRATATGEDIAASGWASFSGAVLTGAADDDRDGRAVAGVSAGDRGGELRGASIAYRPERGDLLVRWDVTNLPGVAAPGPGAQLGLFSAGLVPSVAGLPATVYGLELVLGGIRHEVRALRASAAAVPPGAPLFALYRCEAACLEVARLAGGFGSAGEEVRAAVPLSTLGAAPGQTLGSLRASTGHGEAATGSAALMDDVALGSVEIPVARVELGVAQAATPANEVAFDVPAQLSSGAFAASVQVPEGHALWARACLGSACSDPLPA